MLYDASAVEKKDFSRPVLKLASCLVISIVWQSDNDDEFETMLNSKELVVRLSLEDVRFSKQKLSDINNIFSFVLLAIKTTIQIKITIFHTFRQKIVFNQKN